MINETNAVAFQKTKIYIAFLFILLCSVFLISCKSSEGGTKVSDIPGVIKDAVNPPEWKIQLTRIRIGTGPFGVNLTFPLSVVIFKEFSLDPYKKPLDFNVRASNPDAVDIKIGTATPESTQNAIIVEITPLQEGSFQLEFSASNIDESEFYQFEASNITHSDIYLYTENREGQVVSAPIEMNGNVFTGSYLVVGGNYYNNDTLLRGETDYYVTYGNIGVTRKAEYIRVNGPRSLRPRSLVVDTQVAPQNLVIGTNVNHFETSINLVDNSAIDDMHYPTIQPELVNGQLLLDLTGNTDNRVAYFDLDAIDVNGNFIHGKNSEIYDLQFSNDSVVKVITKTFDRFVLAAENIGTTVLIVSWGNATTSFDIVVN